LEAEFTGKFEAFRAEEIAKVESLRK